ncbi:apolipoprotein N-acyltransferase [Collimonas sp. NPDC087041]|uniref:apolipoprotein N-acyltransferase n=1 Tax=Collimonas sp. NPDC087041 TaxID=3363960 RepID=UPI0037FD55F4
MHFRQITLPRLSLLLPLAALTGAINVFAFAPYGLWPLQLLTLALLIFCVNRAESVKQAALVGWAYGFGWVSHGVYWLYISMHDFGGMPGWLAALAVALLALAMGLYTALGTGLARWLQRRWAASPLLLALAIFPALWGLTEWLRGWLFTGFPWLISGYAHTVSPLAGFAPLVGVYGIGCISALIAGCLALLPQRRLPAVAALLILVAGFGLHRIDWTAPSGQPISVRLLQGNVPQEEKFDEAQIGNTLRLYADMIRAVPADLIATPETAIPILQTQLPPEFPAALIAFSQQTGSNIALGIPYIDGPNRYANSIIGIAPQGNSPAHPGFRYDKQHLVPFGEFVPFGFRWFVDMMNIPLGDFTRGAPVQAPFSVKDQWVLPNICYEDLFGEEIARQLAATMASGAPTATMLLNMSNIAWFGNTIALPQHLQISQMRSLETGRPMLRATNTGTTAVIDPHGNVSAQLPRYSRGTLAVSVQGYSGSTPYILFGNRLLLAAALLMLAGSWWWSRRRRR